MWMGHPARGGGDKRGRCSLGFSYEAMQEKFGAGNEKQLTLKAMQLFLKTMCRKY